MTESHPQVEMNMLHGWHCRSRQHGRSGYIGRTIEARDMKMRNTSPESAKDNVMVTIDRPIKNMIPDP
jgi:hypothetical protein